MSLNLYRFALTLYMLGTATYVLSLFLPNKWTYRTATASLVAGFILHTGSFTSQIATVSFPPVTNLHDALSFMSWAIIGIYLVVLIRYKIRVIGVFISPVALILMLSAYGMPKEIAVFVVPYMKTFWLPVHIILVFLGNGFFAVAFAVAVMYLIQERQLKSKKIGKMYHLLPSINILDTINHMAILWGFPLLTLGIIFGAVVARNMRGGFFSWGNNEIWTLTTWILSAVLIHGRIYSGWRGKKAAILSIFTFIVLLITFFGINILFGRGISFH